jgi:hypothetical protein
MKVTAILPDELVSEVQKYSGGKNITDSLQKALSEWLKQAKIRDLNAKLHDTPLSFKDGFSAQNIRNLNQR